MRGIYQELDGPIRLPWMPQPQYHKVRIFAPRQSFFGLTPTLGPSAPSPPNRVARPQYTSPSLAIACPQLSLQDGTKKRTLDHSGHDHPALIIKPDQMGCTLPDPVAHETVVSVGYPRFGLDCFRDSANELVRSMPT